MHRTFRPQSRPMSVIVTLAAMALVLVPSGRFYARPENPGLPQRHLIPAVVYVSGDKHIHEIALKGTWHDRDLTAAAGAPLVCDVCEQAMAFRRNDGVSMVVYLGKDFHIHALYLQLLRQGNSFQEVWRWDDLSSITGSPPPLDGAMPYGYVRSDGITAVVYTGSDHFIYELWLGGSWNWANLTALSGAPIAYNDAVAYVRSDGINAVIFQAAVNYHIHELWLDHGWNWCDLTSLSGHPPLPIEGLSPYARSDGISTINYTSIDGHINELRLDFGWRYADLTPLSGAPPAANGDLSGYVRSDGINTLVFAGYGTSAHRIYELRLDNGWQCYELTSVSGAVLGSHISKPVGYVRSDGVSAVVYMGTDSHIHEIRLEDAWYWADLSFLAGSPAATGDPWPYNRSAVSSTYLPAVVRR